jgi:hypothetical protein
MKKLRFNVFYNAHVIENHEDCQDDEDLKKLLQEDFDLVNCQHSHNGQTIMHVAEKLMNPEQVATLYRKGRRVDIRDF